MALMNVSQQDLRTVTEAAVEALASGNVDSAVQLDILARKMDAALTNLDRAMAAHMTNTPMHPLRWQDMQTNLA